MADEIKETVEAVEEVVEETVETVEEAVEETVVEEAAVETKTEQAAPKKKKKFPVWAIILIIVAVLGVLAVIGIVIVVIVITIIGVSAAGSAIPDQTPSYNYDGGYYDGGYYDGNDYVVPADDTSSSNPGSISGYSYEDFTGRTLYQTVDGGQTTESNYYWEFIDSTNARMVMDTYVVEATYDVLYNYEAGAYITNEMPQYGVTAEEQSHLITNTLMEPGKDYIVIVFKDPVAYRDGVESEEQMQSLIPFFGYVYEAETGERYYDLAGMNSANYTQLVEK